MPSAKKTKIVATIGPASNTQTAIIELIRAGANVFRLNFSHGDMSQKAAAVKAIRAASKKTRTPVGILADLQGPKIRIGMTKDDREVSLQDGATVLVTQRSTVCTGDVISITYSRLLNDVLVGHHILINDGEICLKVLKKGAKGETLVCTVERGGVFSSKKGVNLPDSTLKIQAFTSKDRKNLGFILKQDIDFVALSFVRNARDLKPVQSAVKKSGRNVKIIAKIEKPEAVREFSSILKICDGIMVARGDLGVETSLYEVPVVQKSLIVEANSRGKTVIVATQMLESMIKSQTPTRAECSDVANAIIDGTDAVMLSGETAIGSYPTRVVGTMSSIAASTESSIYYKTCFVDLNLSGHYPPHAICEAARWASRDLGGIPVCVFTMSGDTAFYLSKIRNQSPIYAFSPDPEVVNQLAIAWNTTPFLIQLQKDIVGLAQKAEAILLKHNLIHKGQMIVVVSGEMSVKGATSSLRIKAVGDL